MSRRDAIPENLFTISSKPRSATIELRPALLVECAQALLAVLGSDEAVVGLDLELHGGGEIPVQTFADRPLGLPHCEGCERGDAVGGRQGLPHHPAGPAELVDD